MIIKVKDRDNLKRAAAGSVALDLVVKNVNIVNVFTGEIFYGAVGIYKNTIAVVDMNNEYGLSADNMVDGNGKYLIPGLIDAHIHIESTMMAPYRFTKAAVVHGTTTVITDPHEIANVCGVEGVEYMLESSEELPMRHFILAPSCVPSVSGKENAGAEFSAVEIEKLLKHDRVIGIAEVMDFIGVINNDKRMNDIVGYGIDKDVFLQGHAPFLSGRKLSAYLCGGLQSDHECRNGEEAVEKMRNGMFVDARESSITKNLKDIIPAVKNFKYHDYLTLCTDDKEADDIIHNGHMNEVVRMAVKYGLDPIDAVRSATLNVAREVGIKNLGAIAPGYIADMVVVDDLEQFNSLTVIYGGEIVAENGNCVVKLPSNTYKLEKRNTVNVPELTINDFIIKTPVKNGKVNVNVMAYESQTSSFTKLKKLELECADGCLKLPENSNLFYVAVINRYGKGTMSLAVVENFGLKCGAAGSTVSHDSHNLTIVYDDPATAYAIYKSLSETGGGIACGKGGKVTSVLPLEIGGLMTAVEPSQLAESADKTKKALRELGLTELPNPLLRIVTLALIVIPTVKISDLGLVDVLKQEFINLFD